MSARNWVASLLVTAGVGCSGGGAITSLVHTRDDMADSGLAPACIYFVVPAAMNFGLVKPGSTNSASLTIEDVGASECSITNLRLSPGTELAFSLPEGAIDAVLLAPADSGEASPSSLVVTVMFQPLAAGLYSGTVAFTVNDPVAPLQTVQLSGVSESKCLLVQPAVLDFGTVGLTNGQYCANGKRKFVAANGCSSNTTITAVALTDGPFIFDSIPSLPLVVSPGQTSEAFVVGFKPSGDGTYEAEAVIETDLMPMPFVVSLIGSAVSGIDLSSDGGSIADAGLVCD